MLTTASNALDFPLLSLLIFLPLLGALVVSLLPRGERALAHAVAVLVSGAVLVLAGVILAGYDADWVNVPGKTAFQFADPAGPPAAWLPGGITYQVAVDGISVVLVFLTALLTFLALVYSWSSVRERVVEYVSLLLLLETGLLGVFSALDLFLFYVFWELVLIPLALLIGVWGGRDRVHAAVKLLLYSLGGSALMLLAIVALRVVSGSETFHLFALLAREPLPARAQSLLFGAFALAFAVKVPLFPLHTWLRAAHGEAPTAAAVLLAGVVLKMGAYGFVRLGLPLFPAAAVAAVPWVFVLAVVGIWYGAWLAFAQEDIKSVVAWSSVSHMGLVMVGLFALNAQGMAGGVLQMFNHGLSTGALFLLVGMLHDRARTGRIAELGGLWASMPRYSALFLVVMLSSIGLPGLCGFVGEWLALLGAFRANMAVGVLAGVGVVLAAVYMLWLYQRVFCGPPTALATRLPDLGGRETLVVLCLVVLMVWIGVRPAPFLAPIERTGQAWVTLVTSLGALAGAP